MHFWIWRICPRTVHFTLLKCQPAIPNSPITINYLRILATFSFFDPPSEVLCNTMHPYFCLCVCPFTEGISLEPLLEISWLSLDWIKWLFWEEVPAKRGQNGPIQDFSSFMKNWYLQLLCIFSFLIFFFRTKTVA